MAAAFFQSCPSALPCLPLAAQMAPSAAMILGPPAPATLQATSHCSVSCFKISGGSRQFANLHGMAPIKSASGSNPLLLKMLCHVLSYCLTQGILGCNTSTCNTAASQPLQAVVRPATCMLLPPLTCELWAVPCSPPENRCCSSHGCSCWRA